MSRVFHQSRTVANYTNQAVTPESEVTYAGVLDTSLTASQLVSSDASKKLSSTLLTDWLAGTSNQVAVTADGSGGAVLSTSQDLHSAASPTFAGATFSGMTADRILGTGTASVLESVNLTDYIAGTTNQVTVTTDGVGGVTLSAPQDLAAASSPSFTGLTVSGLTATRLVASDGASAVASTALSDWVTGTSNRVTVTNDGDGTITLSGPQDLGTTSTPSFNGVNMSASTPTLGMTSTSVSYNPSGGQGSVVTGSNPQGEMSRIRFSHSGTGTDNKGQIYFYASDGSTMQQQFSTESNVVTIGTSGRAVDVNPGVHNQCDLGTAAIFWHRAYITTIDYDVLNDVSDETVKTDIVELPETLGVSFLKRLRPRRFKWKETSKDQRPRAGLVAQEVKQALLDHGIKEEESSFFNEEGGKYSLQSQQFIACLIKAIQELDARVTSLES